jgi:hypothetical protein
MTVENINSTLLSNPHQAELKIATDIQKRLTFFISTCISEIGVPYFAKYLQNSKNKINNKKAFQKFQKYLDFPLAINEFSEYIFGELYRIFEGQNSYFELTTKNYIENFDFDFYKNAVWEKYKTAPNSIIILDTAKEQVDNFPEIKKIFIDISQIKDFSLKNRNQFEYIIFSVNDILYYFDENKIISYAYNAAENKATGIINEIQHDYKFCPASFISNEILNEKSDFVRSNIAVKSLSALEDLQTILTYKKILTPHAFYHFTERFKNSNNCAGPGNSICQDGFLYDKTNRNIPLYSGDGTLATCPICNEDIGIGNEIKKSLNFVDSQTGKTTGQVINFIAPDTEVLKYGDEFIAAQKDILVMNIIGKEATLNSKLNHNVDAYAYNSESREIVLLRLKSNFEVIAKDIEFKSLFIKYSENDLKVNINFGTEFLLATVADLYAEKEQAEKIGVDMFLNLNERIINTKFKTNENQKKRALLLEKIYPNIKDIDFKFQNNLIPENIYYLQIYFKDFINWFETNIFELPSNEHFDITIKKINEQFINYLKIRNNDFTRNPIIANK